MRRVKRTERGWPGHFINAKYCIFRQNTLLEREDVRVVISTIRNYYPSYSEDKPSEVGPCRFYETMAFYSDPDDTKYYDADVTREVSFKSNWIVRKPDGDNEANEMHEGVVDEIEKKILHRELEE